MIEQTTYVAVPKLWMDKIECILSRIEERMDGEKPDEMLSVKQATEMLHVTPPTWAKYRKRFGVRVSLVGRRVMVARSEIERVINELSYKTAL